MNHRQIILGLGMLLCALHNVYGQSLEPRLYSNAPNGFD